jgi:hypothetical protein
VHEEPDPDGVAARGPPVHPSVRPLEAAGPDPVGPLIDWGSDVPVPVPLAVALAPPLPLPVPVGEADADDEASVAPVSPPEPPEPRSNGGMNEGVRHTFPAPFRLHSRWPAQVPPAQHTSPSKPHDARQLPGPGAPSFVSPDKQANPETLGSRPGLVQVGCPKSPHGTLHVPLRAFRRGSSPHVYPNAHPPPSQHGWFAPPHTWHDIAPFGASGPPPPQDKLRAAHSEPPTLLSQHSSPALPQ